jgi:hypothetical protein
MHQKPRKYAHSNSLDAKQFKVLIETHWKQKNRWKTQSRLNWMSWIQIIASDEPTPLWVLRLEFSKVTIGWTDGPNISSSSHLGFGNSKDWSSVSLALDDPTSWPAVQLTPSIKLDRDTPRILLQHQMNRRFMDTLVVHPTLVIELHSTAPSGCSSAPDRLMVRRCIVSVQCLGDLGSTAILAPVSVTGWSDVAQGGPSVHPTVLLFKETFPTFSHPC